MVGEESSGKEDIIDDFLTKRKYGKRSDITQDIRFLAGIDDYGLGTLHDYGTEMNDDRKEENGEVKKIIISVVM
jgi:hypothetical protein